MYSRKKSKKVLYGSFVLALLNGVVPAAFAANANHAPTLVEKITDQTVILGQSSVQLIDLSRFFSDADGDELSFTAVSMNKGVVSVAVSSSQLTILPLSPGTSKIQIAVNDGKSGRATASFSVTVDQSPTVVNPVSNQTTTVGAIIPAIDLGNVFTDNDGDPLTFSATSSDTQKVTADISGNVLTLTPLAIGTSTINVTANDGRGGTESTSFMVTANPAPPVNHAPAVANPVSNQTTIVGAVIPAIDLSPVFTDIDGDPLTFSATSSDTQKVTTNVSGNVLTLTPLAIGTSTINVTANDGRGGTESTSFMVAVNPAPPVNHAPTVANPVSNQTTIVGAVIPAIDLSPIFTDNDGDPLTFSATSSDTQKVTANVYGNSLTLTPLAIGTSTINVTADDGRGGTKSTSFMVTVNPAPPVNHAPVVANPVSNQTTTVGATIPAIDLSPVFMDIDGDPLTFSATSSDTQKVTANVYGNSLTLTPLAVGTSTINVTADDGRGGTVPTSFMVTVNPAPPVNHAPVVANPVSNQTTTVGAVIPAIDLGNVFADNDGDPLTFAATSSDTQKVTASVYGNSLTLTPLAIGTSTINVTADDGRGGTVPTSFMVTVNPAPPVNHAPVVANPVSNQTTTVGATIPVIDLSPVFTDIDGDPLTLSATSSDTQKVTVNVSSHSLTLTPLAIGTSTINVTADDGRGGTKSTSFVVTVNPAISNNHAPTADAAIYEQVLTSGITNDRSYDLSQLFSDADGDPLQFSAAAGDNSVVSVSVNGSTLTLSAGTSAGSTTVTVQADDGNGGVTPYKFKVRNAPSVNGGLIIVRTKQGVKDPLSYDLSTLFPGQTAFTTYMGTPDSTFTGPTPLAGKTLPLTVTPLYTWVIGADGKAAVIQVIADAQGSKGLYFSQYLDGGDGRIALQMYYNGAINQPDNGTGYELAVYKWNKKANTLVVESNPIQLINPVGPNWINPYIVIDSIFYDFFDLANAWYYNLDTMLYDPSNYNVVAYVLKKNGQIVDVLGDPTSHNQFMPSGGTIIRKSGIWSGSKAYSEAGEWNKLPLTYALIGQHTP
ncbi:hypothetical protein PAESOLCIP111_03803 [Paenibacillus solanacearum]|uniref:Cadherin domain-containing protein n=1 Tax=Paenibacillus solanacearum TaxID=2048548 RepID=A0A916K3I6_9BACL|nr:hypothetical protein [Paenibacillus solanacearum]CAG7636979.1 hypothetical protein PAESOLCIP111_03803 [Paenibacillus solanacearum]